MGEALGVDLGAVRVHTDPASAESADAIGARAYTAGSDVYFAAGQYAPTSEDGQRLLAHELAHVVQQRSASLQPVRRKRNKERQQNERLRLWTERLQGPPAVLTAADAQLLATTALAGGGVSMAVLEDMAPLLAGGWTHAPLVALARKYGSVPGELSATQWRMIAQVPAAANQADVVARFARTGNDWLAGHLAALIGQFFAINGGLTAAQWVLVAAEPIVSNQPAEVTAFARLAGWNHAQKLALVKAFAAGAGGLTPAQFIAIAAAHGNLADHPEHVSTFARVAGWNAAGKLALSAAWGADAGTLQPVEWNAIAVAHGVLANDSVAVAGFARMAGWTAANKANLAALFGADPGGRTAAQWQAIAVAHGGLADHEADVAAFARVANGWTAANLATLGGLFGADAGARTVTDWVQLAGGHAGVADHEQVVAGLARAGWLAVDLTNFFAQAIAAGMGAPAAVAVLTIAGAPAHSRAMLVAGWTAADLGTFVGTAGNGGLTAAAVAGLMGTAGMPAATVEMRASWASAQLAQFVIGAIQAGTNAAALRPLFALPAFPARSFALVAGTWTDVDVGTFCGAALADALPAADLLSLISRPNMGTALESMTTAGLNHDDLGAITAVARVAGVTEARLQLMMEDANFQAGTVLMTAAGWTTDDLGNFIAGIDRTNLPVADIGTLSNTANFGTNSHPWIAAGFTADEVGQICGHARLANGGAFLPAPLTTFLGTANAETHAAALNGVWTVPDIGTTIGYCRTQAGPPTDAQMVDLLERAAVPAGVGGGAQIQADWVQHAALAATCGAPAWAQVIAETITFQAHWLQGPQARANEAPVVNGGVHGPPAYQVEIELRGERIEHVEKGHTYEYHEFSFANCTRKGVGFGGAATFEGPPAVDPHITDILVNLQGAVGATAENAAWGWHPTQGNAMGYRYGVLPAGGPYGPPPQTYPTYISQAYPTAGHPIVGRDLVAIGRIFGQIP